MVKYKLEIPKVGNPIYILRLQDIGRFFFKFHILDRKNPESIMIYHNPISNSRSNTRSGNARERNTMCPEPDRKYPIV